MASLLERQRRAQSPRGPRKPELLPRPLLGVTLAPAIPGGRGGVRMCAFWVTSVLKLGAAAFLRLTPGT